MRPSWEVRTNLKLLPQIRNNFAITSSKLRNNPTHASKPISNFVANPTWLPCLPKQARSQPLYVLQKLYCLEK
ncbi:hypothetical protein PSHT_14272 [Puccinia striiformis]|uniref:Uncharacterized protein n=1 Tax=Puccinia striiformis TaxID=27350 RepID=A0A2S4UL09_9BASI|nr:hypothetical protein PSHT_14272 [Puccinia striiformis]